MRATAAAIFVSAIAASASLLVSPAVAAPATSGTASLSAAATSSSSLRPRQFVSVKAEAGPGAGQVTFRWSHDGRSTTGYELITALTQFSKSSTSSLPRTGRHERVWAISPQARSFTMSADELKTAGAPVGSGNNLYFRLYARNAAGKGVAAERAYPKLGAVLPSSAPVGEGAAIRIASFNVRTARVTSDKRPWLERRVDVAAQIKAEAPEIVALQELGPGRADGGTGKLNGAPRQTESLVSSLDAIGAGRYQLVRTTAYAEPGTPTGTQGMRIMYDTTKAKLLSSCSEKTGKSNYSADCSFKLPLLDSDKETDRRRGAYAEFRDIASGKRFFVVSVHLDTRHDDKSTAKEKVYNKLRASQVAKVLSTLETVNPDHLPVVVAGDMNSWQNISVGNGPHDALVADGYTDTASADETVNRKYSTFNGFATTQKASAMGFGSRLDLIATKGFAGATRFENVTKVTDSSRPSDHNMIVADTVL